MKIKKFLTSLALVLAIASICLGIKYAFETNIAQAQFDGFLKEIEETTELPTYDIEKHGQSINKAGVSNITSAFFYLMDFMKLIIGAIAIVMLIIAGVRLILARKKIDEVWPKQKDHLIYITVAFVMIMVADVIVKQIFFGMEGEVYTSEGSVQAAAGAGTAQLKGMYNVVMMLAGALAIFMLIIAGFRLLTGAGNEEAQTKVKKQITWLIVGLLVIGIAEFVVQDFLFPDQGAKIPAAQQGIKLIVSFTNFVSAFISIAAFVASIYGGYLYVAATGNEEKTTKAKKVLFGAIIALVLGLGAFALVNAIIKFEPGA
ncbi:hypothetical protein ACFLZH_04945 [Patescibacteria group bacterium]